jgi:bifunctional DNase/RNase
VKVVGVVSDSVFDSPAVVLLEEKENIFLPIWIGSSEALAIQLELLGEKARRPLTSDLATDIITRLGAKVERVDITMVKNDTYFATLKVRKGDQKIESVDARPSDAIGLALRFKAPVYVDRNVLKEFGVSSKSNLQSAREKIRKS